MNGDRDEELRALWRGQKVDTTKIDLEDVMKRETKMVRKVRIRDAMEYVAGAFVVVFFGAMTVKLDGWAIRLSCLLIVGATAVVLARLRKSGTIADPPPSAAPTHEHVAYLRAQLVRQRDLIAGVPRWYLGPLAAASALFYLAAAWGFVSRGMPIAILAARMARPLFVTFGLYALIYWGNRRGARKLTREIAALDAE